VRLTAAWIANQDLQDPSYSFRIGCGREEPCHQGLTMPLVRLDPAPARRNVCQSVCGSSGSPQHLRWPVSEPSVNIRSTVHQACRPGFILLRRVPSSEYLRLRSRPLPFGRVVLLGFLPSSRHHRCASTHYRRVSNPCYVPSPGDRSLSTSSSALRLRGFFHPRAASRALFRSGVSPPAQRARLFAASCPHAVSTTLLSTNLPARPSTSVVPRLRGFGPRGDAIKQAE